ncbi:MAG: flavodoxin family protein [bacterium]|nr:flavodoxin family protein [bacterium]
MTKILAFNGSPRVHANSLQLLEALCDGAREVGAEIEMVQAYSANIKPCKGCLRCNVVKRCVIKGDDWPTLAERIGAADILVFASPVYFHHVSAPLKKIIDRFRSFMHVQITADGLIHTPHEAWRKRIVLIQTLGSSARDDAQPAQALFRFIAESLGEDTELDTITGTRLAVPRQLGMSVEELQALYGKLQIPAELAIPDQARNAALLAHARKLGADLVRSGR